ncbi:hypothetical protein LTR53_015214 [Teratosphaeriaceae sp. CCFEE 6253]|nr:hypothetical protein LTR53_015214 [Teratosphaeriaceae sp. CCFEE 6253]
MTAEELLVGRQAMSVTLESSTQRLTTSNDNPPRTLLSTHSVLRLDSFASVDEFSLPWSSFQDESSFQCRGVSSAQDDLLSARSPTPSTQSNEMASQKSIDFEKMGEQIASSIKTTMDHDEHLPSIREQILGRYSPYNKSANIVHTNVHVANAHLIWATLDHPSKSKSLLPSRESGLAPRMEIIVHGTRPNIHALVLFPDSGGDSGPRVVFMQSAISDTAGQALYKLLRMTMIRITETVFTTLDCLGSRDVVNGHKAHGDFLMPRDRSRDLFGTLVKDPSIAEGRAARDRSEERRYFDC